MSKEQLQNNRFNLDEEIENKIKKQQELFTTIQDILKSDEESVMKIDRIKAIIESEKKKITNYQNT